MKIRLLALLLAFALIGTSGCKSGPIGRFFRGGACNTCNPPRPGLFNWRGNTATTCESDACDHYGMEGSVGGMPTGYSGTATGGYGVDPFGTSEPVYSPISPPANGKLPGPTGQ